LLLILGGILIDACKIEGDVDYSSRVGLSSYLEGDGLIGRFVVITGLSAAVAWVLAKMFKLKRSQT